jgi:NADPH-dependent 2,4-dienoyl-CoA reductase/sulfur reductase-like enzyme
LPHVVAGLATVDSITNPDGMFEKAGIELYVDKAVDVDMAARTVTLAGGKQLAFTKLVMGTGSSPFVPPIPGVDSKGVFTLRDADDAVAIADFLKERRAKKLVFIGAGFISLELGSLLLTQDAGLDITIVEIMDHPLPLMVDADSGATIAQYLTEKGLRFQMGKKVVGIEEENGVVRGVTLDGGERLDADMVLLSAGTRPNLELAQKIGLEIGRFGVQVNEFLETSAPGVYAGGDVAEIRNFITGKPSPSLLRGLAVIQGRLIAKRMAGFAIPFPGTLNNSVVRLFDKYIGAVGFTERDAAANGFAPVAVTVGSRSRHGMIPGVKPWTLKLVFDRQSQKLLGGQIISDSEAPVKEIDTINALILGGKTAADLTTVICAGNPDCSSEPSLEPISLAGEQALQKMKG